MNKAGEKVQGKKKKESTDKGYRNHRHRYERKERVGPLVRKVLVHALRKQRKGRSKKVPWYHIKPKTKSNTSDESWHMSVGTYDTCFALPTQMTHMDRSLTETKKGSTDVSGSEWVATYQSAR